MCWFCFVLFKTLIWEKMIKVRTLSQRKSSFRDITLNVQARKTWYYTQNISCSIIFSCSFHVISRKFGLLFWQCSLVLNFLVQLLQCAALWRECVTKFSTVSFFHDSNPSGPQINRHSVSISPRYSIPKIKKNSTPWCVQSMYICITPRSQNFSLSKSKTFSSNLFFHVICVHP